MEDIEKIESLVAEVSDRIDITGIYLLDHPEETYGLILANVHKLRKIEALNKKLDLTLEILGSIRLFADCDTNVSQEELLEVMQQTRGWRYTKLVYRLIASVENYRLGIGYRLLMVHALRLHRKMNVR